MSQQQQQLAPERMRPEYVDAIVDTDLEDNDKLSETINTSRVEDNRDKDNEGTIFGGLFQ